MTGTHHVEVFQREDGRWAWRTQAANGQIVATDGGQGFENRVDAVDAAIRENPGVPLETQEQP